MVFIPTANCMCIPITYYLQRIYSISIPLYIITALSFFDGSAEHWWTLFLTGAAMGLIFCVTSCIIMCQSGPENDEALGKSMEIGLKWISFSGVLPLLFVYTIGWSPCFLTSIIIICTFASEEFLNKFYKPTVGKTTTDYSFRPKTVCFLGFLHITGAALGINYSFKYKSFEDFLAVSIYQVIFTVFYGTCTIDYFVGASVVTIKDKRKQQEDMVTVCAKLAKEDPTRLGNGIK
uniref:7TM_GPCR_Srx domain-containing protein n=1 Tax=Caenorhabditis tropicalis TaxID=1561998 RepID=A0A1I7USM9_9PELO